MRIDAPAIAVLLVVLFLHGSHPARAAQDGEGVSALLARLQQAVAVGDPAGYLALVADSSDRQRARDFAAVELRPGAARVVLLERDRAPAGDGVADAYRLVVDVFVDFGARGRVATWQLDLQKTTANVWTVANQERLSSVDNLYRLVLNSTRQFAARNFTIQSEDFDLTLDEGSVFTMDADRGLTALVLLGQGTMRFHPTPPVEKAQVTIFGGAETVASRFDGAFIRLGALGPHADLSRLTARSVDARDLRRAELLFQEEASKSFSFDLREFSSEAWTVLPAASDFLAEVRTRRFGTLTYSQSNAAFEDISLFDRLRQKNIAVYPSAGKLAAHGPFYGRADPPMFDVRHYDMDVAFDPARRWIEGRALLRITVGPLPTSQLTLRLAPSLTVQSVTSDQFGRLFSIRVRNQDTLLVILPVLLLPDADITLTVSYSGRLSDQPADLEMLAAGQREVDPLEEAVPQFYRMEPHYLYSSRSNWYPHPTVGDYATATLRVTIPVAYECVASGAREANPPALVDDPDPLRRRKRIVFTAERPLLYLSFLVSRLTAVADVTDSTLKIAVLAHAALVAEARDVPARAADVAQFYRSMAGDSPYPSLTFALLESRLPGGHSPAYLALLNRPPPGQPRVWRNDPVAFDKYEEFFPAHEIAHQWWGQAVGWSTYHDQWLSEGFAQYFAALYTGRQRGDEVLRSIMHDMRKWALKYSDQGPVYLGYRLGHVHNDSRVFRALVYDKGAMVLHMLRRLVGDEAFFRGIRRYYAGFRYQRAATEDLRRAMEVESGGSLERFFERWIYGSTLPRLKFSYHVEPSSSSSSSSSGPSGPSGGRDIVLRVDQTGELFDVPVTITLQYASGASTDVVMKVTERAAQLRVPLTGALRRVEVNRDEGTLAEVRKN